MDITKTIEEEKFKWENESTFGYDPIKDKERIERLRRWYTCSFCGRPSECRPHAPLVDDDWFNWKILPIRLCFYCAGLQDMVRQLCVSVKKEDGN